ncbi:MAG: carboxypeptidase regulatory-like domain-containing protein [Planctomycetota bacterium]
MSRRTLPAILLLLVGAALAGLLFMTGSPFSPAEDPAGQAGSQPGPSFSGTAPVPRDARIREGRSGLDLPDGTRFAETGAGIPSFRGRLLLPDGSPASDAPVRAWGLLGVAYNLDPQDPRIRPRVEWETRAAPDGTFHFPEAPDDDLRFLLRAASEGLPPLQVVNLATQPGRTRELGDLRFSRGFQVSGTIEDLAGKPLASARVRLLPEAEDPTWVRWNRRRMRPLPGWEAATDVRGTFLLKALPAGRFRLWAEHPGFVPGFSAPFEGGEREEVRGITVSLPPSLPLQGSVVGPRAEPLAGARIEALFSNLGLPIEALTGADGRFRLDLPEETGPLRLRVRAPGFRTLLRSVAPRGRRQPVRLELSPLPPVRGRVVDQQGRPIPGARVALIEARRIQDDDFPPERAPASRSTISGEDGSFEITLEIQGQADDRYRVGAWLPGLKPAWSEVLSFADALPSSREPAPLRLILAKGRTVRGSVQDSEGRPQADVRVRLVKLFSQAGAGQPGAASRIRRRGRLLQAGSTDGQGRFQFAGLPEGEFRLEAHAPGFAPAESPPFPLHGADFETRLSLPLPARIEGRVAGEGRLPEALRVMATSTVSDPLEAMVDSSGAFLFPDLPAGSYTLALQESPSSAGGPLQGLVTRALPTLAERTVFVAAGQTLATTLEPDLEGRASLSGTVEINEAPRSDLGVYLLPTGDGSGGGDPRFFLRSRVTRLRGTTTEFQGHYRFNALEPGSYWIVVERPDSFPGGVFRFDPGNFEDTGPRGLARAEVTLHPGEEQTLDLAIRAGSLRGTASFETPRGTKPFSYGQVRLTPRFAPPGVEEKRIPIAPDGSFSSDLLPAGTWVLDLPLLGKTGDDSSPERIVEIRPGETTVLDLHIPMEEDSEAPRPPR